MTASHVPAAASAAVPAQAIEENASAKVAAREDVCRRRKWLRLAWVRNEMLDLNRRGRGRDDAERGH